MSSTMNECLGVRQVREIYLITYSQVDADLFPTRQSFANIVCEAFMSCNVVILQWVCTKENHTQSGFHFHMTVKLKERHRWKRVRDYIAKEHGVLVNFSNRHDNYFSAWKYTTKEDLEFIQSEGHPDLTDIQPPQSMRASEACRRGGKSAQKGRAGKAKCQKRQLSVYEVSQIAVTKKFRSRLELLAFAQEQQKEGKTDLTQFIANRGSKAVDEAIRVGWELNDATAKSFTTPRSCLPDCNKKWLEMARNILVRNNVEISEFVGAVRLLLE